MTGGAQARLRPSLIPLFPRDKKDEKRNEGKKGICSSVLSVFLGLKGEKREEKGRKGKKRGEKGRKGEKRDECFVLLWNERSNKSSVRLSCLSSFIVLPS